MLTVYNMSIQSIQPFFIVSNTTSSFISNKNSSLNNLTPPIDYEKEIDKPNNKKSDNQINEKKISDSEAKKVSIYLKNIDI